MKDRQYYIKELISWTKYLAASFVFAFIINNTVLINAEVVSPSMESTIMTDSRIFGSRLAYVFQEPQRYDVIVFKFPDDETSAPFVKRVIGLPKEKVEIREGKVYINDSAFALEDSFINEETGGDFGPYTVPDNCFFVMGDNRNDSWDSRDWKNKFVAKDKILGKVSFEWFPEIKIID